MPFVIEGGDLLAWQQGDFVYVCLIRGGPDSLSTLQDLLHQPSA